MLPAREGDCLILTYGDPRRHILVDGGVAESYRSLRPRLENIARRGETLELLVVTHFDADHIEGIIAMLEDVELPVEPRRVWFNGFDQLSRLQTMNHAHADRLSALLRERGWPINAEFPDTIACLGGDGAPIPIRLPGDLVLTLLAPDRPRLFRLRTNWEAVRASSLGARRQNGSGQLQVMGGRRLRAVPVTLDVEAEASARTDMDTSIPNGSSIVLLAEHDGKRVLLAADAPPDVLTACLGRLMPDEGKRVALDLCKLSHHGSAKNTTAGLVSRMDCRRFAISTDGSMHQHPDPPAIARLLRHAPDRGRVLSFNYDQPWTRIWDTAELKERYGYDCAYGTERDGLTVEV